MRFWLEEIARSLSIRWKNKWRQSPIIFLVGFVLTSAVFIYLIIMAFQGAKQLLMAKISFAPGYLALSLACQFLGVLLAAGVWGDILRQLGVTAGYLFDLQAFCLSAVARKIPGMVWYAVSRLAMYKYANWPNSLVILALVVESIMIALGGLVALAVGIFTGAIRVPTINTTGYLLLAIIVFILGVSWLGPRAIRFAVKRRKKSTGDGEVAQFITMDFWDAMRWLIGETVVIVLGAGVAFFMIKSTDANIRVPFTSILGAWGLAVALGPLAVWLPTDIGLKDGVMYLALSPFIGGPLAAVLTLAWRLWVSLLEILFGLVAGITLSKTMGWFPRLQGKGKQIHD